MVGDAVPGVMPGPSLSCARGRRRRSRTGIPCASPRVRGSILKTTGRVHDGKTLLYRASKFDCDPCPLKPRCCPKDPARKIPRDVNEAARDHARALMGTEPYLQSRRLRKKIEARFGDLKWNLGLTRLRLRGLTGARDEFLTAATVQNLRRLARLVARPPPRPIPS